MHMHEYYKVILHNPGQDIFFLQISGLDLNMNGSGIEHLPHSQPLFQFLVWNMVFATYSKETRLHSIPPYQRVLAQELLYNEQFYWLVANVFT